jgi:soluble P-type ATPase
MGNEQFQKAELVQKLGADSVIAIGNGMNDTLLLKNAQLSLAVVQGEGAATEALLNSDIICTDILDALNLLLNPLRVTATLRE